MVIDQNNPVIGSVLLVGQQTGPSPQVSVVPGESVVSRETIVLGANVGNTFYLGGIVDDLES